MIREFRPEDAEAISLFMHTHFLQGVDNIVRSHAPDYYRWKYNETPWGKPAAYVAEYKERLIGLFCVLPRMMLINGKPRRAGETCDAYIAPDFQGKGVFFKLIARAFQAVREQGIDMFYTTANPATYDIWTGPFRFRSVFDYRNLVRPVRFDSIIHEKIHIKPLSTFIGKSFSLSYKLLYPFTRIRSADWEPAAEDQPFFDDLWRKASVHWKHGLIRDGEYMRVRFFSSPENYSIYAASHDGHPLGYAVLKMTLWREMSVGHVVDLLPVKNDPLLIRNILSAAVHSLKAMGAVLISSWAVPGTLLFDQLRRLGFQPRRKVFHLLIGGEIDESGSDSLFEHDTWWYTHGDSDNV